MFRLRVLGGFVLEGPGAGMPQLPKRRAEAVLAMLAVCGEIGCTREKLLALLWPEQDEAHARHGLRDALHGIRRALGPGAIPGGGRLLRLDPGLVASDVLQFRQAMASGRHADAVRVYAGPLLDGFHVDDAAEFERWLDAERTHLAREYAKALKQLAAEAEDAGAAEEAAGWWARAVDHDPPNSHLVLQYVRTLAGLGDRATAIKAAEAHARRLRDEFDLEPDPETVAEIERIRRGEFRVRAKVPRQPLQSPTTLTAGNGSAGIPVSAARPLTSRWMVWAALIVLSAAGAVLASRLPRTRAVKTGSLRTTIAVLPFRNLSADSAHAYFADGLHDELLTQLAKVASLSVVGRTSVTGYHDASKPLRQIGEELNAGSIVDGSVQIVGNRLRVIVHLLDPVTQADRWVERYDRTLDDAFAVQSELAQRIVAGVGAILTAAEADALAAVPTESPEAYQLYLQGRAYHRRPGKRRENLLIAQELYQRALSLDSGFAPAHAAMSYVHMGMYDLRYDRSAPRLELARREADVALRLSPGLPQAHLAAGVRYRSGGRYREAMDEFTLGLRGAPNDVELWTWIGRVHRHLGNWDSALVAFDRARKLDPRDADLLQTIGDTYHFLRRYPEAIASYRYALVLAPDLVQPRLSLAWSYVLWKGALDTLRAALREAPLHGGPGGDPMGEQRLVLLLWERRPDSLLSLLRAMPPPVGGTAPASIARMTWVAQAHSLRGDTAIARAAFDSVVVLLGGELGAHSDEAGAHAARGLALAALGRRADALREARWLERFDDYPDNRFSSGWEGDRTRIMARLGEVDSALALADRALARPSRFSIHELRLSPDFDPIRSDPRFRALLRKYAGPGT